MGKLLALTALLSVVTTGFAQTYTVKNNCPSAIDLHVGNLPAESLAQGATTVKTGLGPLAEFYTTTNDAIVDGRFVGTKAGFHLTPNFWAYYVGKTENDLFNTGISITPSVPEHDGFCKPVECTDPVASGNSCSNGYPTLDQWSMPPGPDDGPIGPPIFQCKDGNVDFTITFCPSGQWPNKPSQVIKPTADQNKCLDVQGAVFQNGTPVQLYDCNGTAAQKWVVAGGAFRSVRLAGTNFCLDAGDNPSQPNGVRMKIWTCYNFLPQQAFAYSSASGWFSITSGFKFAPSYCLDVTDGRFENSNQLQMWECANDNFNQKWVVQ